MSEQIEAPGASQLISLLPGLREISYSFRLTSAEFDFEALRERLARAPFFEDTRDGGFRCVVPGGPAYPQAHAHFVIERDESGFQPELAPRYSFTWEVIATPTTAPASEFTVDNFFAQLGDAAPNANRQLGLISADFLLSLKDWEPTIPLPFTPPGFFDHFPGGAEIRGIDFGFTEGKTQPLVSAFVTTYPLIHDLVVRFLVRYDGVDIRSVNDTMQKVAESHLPTFVRRRPVRQSNE